MRRQPITPTGPRRAVLLTTALLAAALLAACGSGGGGASSSPSTTSGGASGSLRLGFLPNLTQASALIGVENGVFAKALGPGVKLTTSSFTAGPAETQALFSGALDAAFIGPGPAVNAYEKSHGAAIRIIAGATSGGAGLVVDSHIHSVAQLKGTKIATPALGNTQDIALRYYLRQHGIKTTTAGGGQLDIVNPAKNSEAVQLFATGGIQGAWLPEPYLSEMLAEGGHLLVDERTLWPGGRFATTLLAVRTAYLAANPGIVKALLTGQVRAVDTLEKNPTAARAEVNSDLKALTGKDLSATDLAGAFSRTTFTVDPLETTVVEEAAHAYAVGLISKPGNLSGLFDLGPLNAVLTSLGQPTVKE
jgi:NitT/TauT family transport system substrate-binding protein